VIYLSGGPAPLDAELLVENTGRMQLNSLKDKVFCALDPALAQDINQLLVSDGVQTALDQLRNCPELFSINDAEEIVLFLDGEAVDGGEQVFLALQPNRTA
jgi:hypothetical protein